MIENRRCYLGGTQRKRIGEIMRGRETGREREQGRSRQMQAGAPTQKLRQEASGGWRKGQGQREGKRGRRERLDKDTGESEGRSDAPRGGKGRPGGESGLGGASMEMGLLVFYETCPL